VRIYWHLPNFLELCLIVLHRSGLCLTRWQLHYPHLLSSHLGQTTSKNGTTPSKSCRLTVALPNLNAVQYFLRPCDVPLKVVGTLKTLLGAGPSAPPSSMISRLAPDGGNTHKPAGNGSREKRKSSIQIYLGQYRPRTITSRYFQISVGNSQYCC
jgi:hypothetical protein